MFTLQEVLSSFKYNQPRGFIDIEELPANPEQDWTNYPPMPKRLVTAEGLVKYEDFKDHEFEPVVSDAVMPEELLPSNERVTVPVGDWGAELHRRIRKDRRARKRGENRILDRHAMRRLGRMIQVLMVRRQNYEHLFCEVCNSTDIEDEGGE